MLAVLEQPRWWVMALAAFLLRGGILLLLLLIVPIPTTAGLANSLGPTLVGFVFGGASASFVVLVGALSATLLAWLLLGGLVGAWLDLVLVREVAARNESAGPDRAAVVEGDHVPPGPSGRFAHGGVARALLVRLLAHLPTLVVIVWGAARLVDQGYQELIRPGDPTLPVVLRVVLRVPEVVGLLLAAWMAGEALGGLAVRHLAAGASVLRSIGRAAIALVRPTGLLVLVLTNGVIVAFVGLGGLAVAIAYSHARAVLQDGIGGAAGPVALLLLSIAWLGSLAVIGLAAAWRSAAWTFEVERRLPDRTAGPSGH